MCIYVSINNTQYKATFVPVGINRVRMLKKREEKEKKYLAFKRHPILFYVIVWEYKMLSGIELEKQCNATTCTECLFYCKNYQNVKFFFIKF